MIMPLSAQASFRRAALGVLQHELEAAGGAKAGNGRRHERHDRGAATCASNFGATLA